MTLNSKEDCWQVLKMYILFHYENLKFMVVQHLQISDHVSFASRRIVQNKLIYLLDLTVLNRKITELMQNMHILL